MVRMSDNSDFSGSRDTDPTSSEANSDVVVPFGNVAKQRFDIDAPDVFGGVRLPLDAPDPDDSSSIRNGGESDSFSGSGAALAKVESMWSAHDTPPVPRPRGEVPRKSEVTRAQREPFMASLLRMWALLFVLAMVSTFFAWVSADALLLSLGHRVEGVVEVSQCAAGGFAPRCEGAFIPVGEQDLTATVRISGDTEAERVGQTLDAVMVSTDSRTAYIGDPNGLVIRWVAGIFMMLVCGGLISLVTGAWRVPGRARRAAVAVSFGAPLLMFVGVLALSW